MFFFFLFFFSLFYLVLVKRCVFIIELFEGKPAARRTMKALKMNVCRFTLAGVAYAYHIYNIPSEIS